MHTESASQSASLAPSSAAQPMNSRAAEARSAGLGIRAPLPSRRGFAGQVPPNLQPFIASMVTTNCALSAVAHWFGLELEAVETFARQLIAESAARAIRRARRAQTSAVTSTESTQAMTSPAAAPLVVRRTTDCERRCTQCGGPLKAHSVKLCSQRCADAQASERRRLKLAAYRSAKDSGLAITMPEGSGAQGSADPCSHSGCSEIAAAIGLQEGHSASAEAHPRAGSQRPPRNASSSNTTTVST
jgi:hypothetical protein